jgi:hypothetical protein
MIPSTDFDRLITSWLEAAGPADLGRETIDAALQAARGRRQRRGLLAWLVGPGSWPAYGARRGFTALPAILRIALLVGLVLALLGGTLYVGGQVLRPLFETLVVPAPSASPAATATSSPAATATSEASPLGAWVAKRPDNMSFGQPMGTTMILAVGPTTRVRLSSGNRQFPTFVFESSMTVVADHQVRLVMTSLRVPAPNESGMFYNDQVAIDGLWVAGCKLGDVGLYTWSISADGALLTLASDGDACPSREAVLARTWSTHESPFGVWAAPSDVPFRHQRAVHEKMLLDLGESAVVRLPLSYPEFGWYDSTVTRAGDYWEFTSIAVTPRLPIEDGGGDWPVPDGFLPAGCNLGDVGRYVWSLSADGSQLTLASVGDACPSREAVLARTWGFLAPP